MFITEIVKAVFPKKFRKYTFQGLMVFIIGSVFSTISAQKSGCPDDDSNDGDMGGIAGLLIPSCVTDSASLRSMNDTEDNPEGSDVWCLTNRVSFDSFAMTTTSRVFGIGWSQGLSSYFPLLDLAYKQDLTNEEWSVFRTEDVGGSMTNGIVVDVPTAQIPTNSVADKAFYMTFMRKDPNPLRNTDGDYFTDLEELGASEILTDDGCVWYDVSSSGTDLLYPYYQRADLEADVDFQSPHVFNGIAYSGARVTLDGKVYFKGAALTRINTASCPSVRLFGIEPMADAWGWGSGVYFGTVVSDGQTYDVIEYLNIGMYEYIDEPVSPLISCEVIIPRSEPDAIYVSYANVDDEIRNADSWLGYVDTSLESVFVSNGYYQIEYPAGSPRPVPYMTVRYQIGTGTDPRIYDDYTPPACGQTAAERALVETSVGHNLTNGLYELTASVTNNPVVPVRITVGDRSVTMTNRGECVFLCEKGVQYQLAVSPSYFSSVEFSARDDIAPPMMMAGAGGSAGAVWTVDNRLTLVPPSGSVFGSCLWLPTFTAGPNVLGHWYPDDGGMRFTAYLTDYPGSNSVSYAWSCADDNVHIASPSAQSTMVSLRNSPGWGSTDLSVTATVDGYTLSSTLANLEYGTHSSPQVTVQLIQPDYVFVDGELKPIEINCTLEGDKFGSLQLSQISGNGKVRFRRQANGGPVERLPLTIDAFYPVQYELYVEGENVSDICNDIGIRLEYFGNDGDYKRIDRYFTCAKVDKVQVSSLVAGGSANPPPFEGQSNYVFNVQHSISPDKHLPIFFKDVKTDDFGVSDFSVRISLDVLPSGFAPVGEMATWFMLKPSPDSGYVSSRDATSADFCNPKVGGVYKIGCVYAGSPTNTCNIVLPLAGAAIDSVIASDLEKADRVANFLVASYSIYERQQPRFGLQWFNNNGMGDYLGRPDSANEETVWEYNQVNDDTGMGAVATWFGLPIRIAKASNFMVGYETTKIGVCKFMQQLSQVIGNWNDDSASLSWDAGVAVANGSNYVEYVSAMVSNSWSEVDGKVGRLWPNALPCDNHVDGDSLTDYNYQFISPGFLERIMK